MTEYREIARERGFGRLTSLLVILITDPHVGCRERWFAIAKNDPILTEETNLQVDKAVTVGFHTRNFESEAAGLYLMPINISVNHSRRSQIMYTTFAPVEDDKTAIRRETIRQSLNEIAEEINQGLRNAGLTYPVYLVVPSSGKSVLSMLTPTDPSDADWCRTGDIIREVVSEHLDGIVLCSVELPCTIVNSTAETPAITVD